MAKDPDRVRIIYVKVSSLPFPTDALEGKRVKFIAPNKAGTESVSVIGKFHATKSGIKGLIRLEIWNNYLRLPIRPSFLKHIRTACAHEDGLDFMLDIRRNATQ